MNFYILFCILKIWLLNGFLLNILNRLEFKKIKETSASLLNSRDKNNIILGRGGLKNQAHITSTARKISSVTLYLANLSTS